MKKQLRQFRKSSFALVLALLKDFEQTGGEKASKKLQDYCVSTKLVLRSELTLSGVYPHW